MRLDFEARLTIQCRAHDLNPEIDTIIEIGGQDSKYIRIDEGIVTDFTMNEACAAGTGSFLEEQAEKLDIRIVGEFAERAFSSDKPLRLGERCTVFMESDLVHHQQRGVSVDNLSDMRVRPPAGDEEPGTLVEEVVRGYRLGGRVIRATKGIVAAVPDVRKAVRWNSPFYGREGDGWFLSLHCFGKYIKVTFLNGGALVPPPPVESKQHAIRYLHISEDEALDDLGKNPGGAIFIHGGCKTRGCIAVEDEAIKELTETVARRVIRLLVRRGVLDDEVVAADPLS